MSIPQARLAGLIPRDAQRRSAMTDSIKPKPDILQRRGGWFVAHEDTEGWSGPWASEEAAEAARDGDFDKAHDLERDLLRKTRP